MRSPRADFVMARGPLGLHRPRPRSMENPARAIGYLQRMPSCTRTARTAATIASPPLA